MRNGRLRHTAIVYTPDDTPDEYGEYSLKTTGRAYKCSMDHRTHRERPEGGSEYQKIEFKITFKYQEEIELLDPRTEIEVNGRRLVVVSTSDPTGMKREVRMFAEARS